MDYQFNVAVDKGSWYNRKIQNLLSFARSNRTSDTNLPWSHSGDCTALVKQNITSGVRIPLTAPICNCEITGDLYLHKKS